MMKANAVLCWSHCNSSLEHLFDIYIPPFLYNEFIPLCMSQM